MSRFDPPGSAYWSAPLTAAGDILSSAPASIGRDANVLSMPYTRSPLGDPGSARSARASFPHRRLRGSSGSILVLGGMRHRRRRSSSERIAGCRVIVTVRSLSGPPQAAIPTAKAARPHRDSARHVTRDFDCDVAHGSTNHAAMHWNNVGNTFVTIESPVTVVTDSGVMAVLADALPHPKKRPASHTD